MSYKKGDKVIAGPNINGHQFKPGELLIITMLAWHKDTLYYVCHNELGQYWYMTEDEFEPNKDNKQ